MGKNRRENIKSIGKAQVTLSLNLRQRGGCSLHEK